MWVKICANTNLPDTQKAIDLGADAVGFVFAPSKRRVTPEQVERIVSNLRGDSLHAERIGVFQNAALDEIIRSVKLARLTGVQLHNLPDPRLIASLRSELGRGVTIVQTIHWTDGAPMGVALGELAEQVRRLEASGQIDRILVDAKVDAKAGSTLGGTGHRFDWSEAEVLFRGAGAIPMIVAGGLDAGNVREAVERLHPWGVDVASGVEQAAGRKDLDRLRLFIETARAAGGGPEV